MAQFSRKNRGLLVGPSDHQGTRIWPMICTELIKQVFRKMISKETSEIGIASTAPQPSTVEVLITETEKALSSSQPMVGVARTLSSASRQKMVGIASTEEVERLKEAKR